MADKSTVRLLFSLAAATNMHMEYMDTTGAYLPERYKHPRPVYIWQRQRFDGTYKHAARAGKLIGNIYGPPPVAHTYTTKLHEHLRSHDYHQTRSNPSLFYKRHTNNIILIAISMDDFLTATTAPAMNPNLYNILDDKGTVKRLGPPITYLNWRITHAPIGINLAQPRNIHSVVKILQLENSDPCPTLYTDGLPVDPPGEDDKLRQEIKDIFGKAIGEIRHIADSTRPYIAFTTAALARAMSHPTQKHWKALKRLGQYLNATASHGTIMQRHTGKL